MKRFMAVYTGTAETMAKWRALPETERLERERRGMKAWQEWSERHMASIVDPGAPLGRTKRISSSGVADIRNALAAYTVVQAESQEAAVQIFEAHPHFAIFPGEAVEVMECLPMPGGS